MNLKNKNLPEEQAPSVLFITTSCLGICKLFLNGVAFKLEPLFSRFLFVSSVNLKTIILFLLSKECKYFCNLYDCIL